MPKGNKHLLIGTFLAVTTVSMLVAYMITRVALDADTQGFAGTAATSTDPEIPIVTNELDKY